MRQLDRRQLARLAGGSAVALSLGIPAGARAQEDEEGVQETTEQEGKVNVTWWTHTNSAFVAANLALIEAFTAENPDINIVYQHFPYDVFTQKLQTGYSTGTVADIQQMFGSWLPEYTRFGLLDPVPDAMAETMRERFWPAAYGAYERDGVFYGQPKEYNLENGGMLVNPALLEAAGASETPTTWDSLVEVAVQATERDANGLITQSGFAFINTDTTVFLFLSMILQQGATYYADDGMHFDLQTDAAKQAWADLTALSLEHGVDSSQSYSQSIDELFFQGRAAMCPKGSWTIAVGLESYPDLDFRYDPVPPYAGEEMLFAADSGWGEVVNASASDEIKEAAWKFIEFSHRPENLRPWNLATFTVPSLQELENDAEILETAPGLATAFAVLQGGQWLGDVGDRDRFFTAIYDAFISADIGAATPDEALVNAERELNAMVDENLGP